MKKYFLLSPILLSAFFAKAQSYEATKNMLIISQYKQAKESLDKNWTNAKFTSKPEAYILKASIYAGLAVDKTVSTTPEGDRLRDEADVAFTKYREMEPDLKLLKDPTYQNAPVHLYSSYFTTGYNNYQKKNREHGYQALKKVMDLSDLLIKEKIIMVAIDTNSLILAGISAENSGHPDDAAIYYSRLADHRIAGPEYESIYSYLVKYYFTKKDMASFEKYKALGKELYPKSEYFTYDKIEFAARLEDDFNKKLQALDEIVKTDPSNRKTWLLIGEIIYDTLDSRRENAVMPANADELENRMVAAFNKAAELEPASEIPYLLFGDHFIAKSLRINDERTELANDIKKRTKPGTMASKEDVQKREVLDEKYGNVLEAARGPYEKAAEIFSKKTEALKLQDKQQYKKAVSYLADIYNYKKMKAKAKPADAAKYAAEEKKWNDLYDSIK